MIKIEDYWIKRILELQEAEETATELYFNEILEAFELASREVRQQTEKYLNIIAENQSVSMANARILLDKKQLKEFKYDLKKFKEIAIKAETDKKWIKKLDNASARVNISRLEALETSIQQSVEVVKAKQLRITTDSLANTVNYNYYSSVYELQKGIGFEVAFQHIDDAQIEKLIKTPWAPDGTNFSARIWGERDKLVAKLRQDLTEQLITGQDYSQLLDSYEREFGVERYKAERLLRTETTFFSNQTRLDGYKATGVKEYKYIAILDNRTSEICDALHNQIFKVKDAEAGINLPATHPNCRSTTIPVVDFTVNEYEGMFDDQLAEFDDQLSLKAWAKKVEVDLSPPKVETPVNVYPNRVVTE